jgi:hypothetical protein
LQTNSFLSTVHRRVRIGTMTAMPTLRRRGAEIAAARVVARAIGA